jgi:hypothetical protein
VCVCGVCSVHTSKTPKPKIGNLHAQWLRAQSSNRLSFPPRSRKQVTRRVTRMDGPGELHLRCAEFKGPEER